MDIEFHQDRGSFTFHNQEVPGVGIDGAVAWLQFQEKGGKLNQLGFSDGQFSLHEEPFSDVHGSGNQIVIESLQLASKVALSLRINQYIHQPFCLLKMAVQNLSAESVYLEQFCLCQVDPHDGGHLDFAGSGRDLRFFKVGWHGWAYTGLRRPGEHNSRRVSDLLVGISYSNPSTPRPYRSGEFWSEGWGILAGADAALVSGFVSTAHQFGQLYASLRKPSPVFKLLSQLDGIRLDPGESCDSEWGYLQFVRLPNPEPAIHFVEAVSRQMQARPPVSPPPPMWTHWYHYYQSISERLFLENLELLAQKRSTLPIEVTELDDGYPSAWGDWDVPSAKFPAGLGDLATKIRLKGFTPGLWLAPFAVQPNSTLAREHPDWLVKDKHGKPIRAGFVYNSFIYALDTSHPAVLDHIRSLMDRIVHQWGFRMIKIDFLYTAALAGERHDPRLTRAECLRQGLEAIRLGAGEETFLLACGCPFGPAIGLVDAMRIGPDTAPSWDPYFNWLPWISPFIRNEESAPSLRNALRHTLNLSVLHRHWWWNDPDCLLARQVESRLTKAEVQSAVTLIGLSGGMVVSSDDLSTLTDERLRWISYLVPNLDLHGRPLDLLSREMPQIYQAQVRTSAGDYTLVGLFNWEDHPAECRINLCDLGFPEGCELEVFDFWNDRHFRTNHSELTFPSVPPHGCILLRICKVTDAPHIVGDTLHISCGSEFPTVVIKDGILRIESLDFNRWVSGRLYLWLPITPVSATCDDDPLQIVPRGDHLYALELHFLGRARIEIVL